MDINQKKQIISYINYGLNSFGYKLELNQNYKARVFLYNKGDLNNFLCDQVLFVCDSDNLIFNYRNGLEKLIIKYNIQNNNCDISCNTNGVEKNLSFKFTNNELMIFDLVIKSNVEKIVLKYNLFEKLFQNSVEYGDEEEYIIRMASLEENKFTLQESFYSQGLNKFQLNSISMHKNENDNNYLLFYKINDFEDASTISSEVFDYICYRAFECNRYKNLCYYIVKESKNYDVDISQYYLDNYNPKSKQSVSKSWVSNTDILLNEMTIPDCNLESSNEFYQRINKKTN